MTNQGWLQRMIREARERTRASDGWSANLRYGGLRVLAEADDRRSATLRVWPGFGLSIEQLRGDVRLVADEHNERDRIGVIIIEDGPGHIELLLNVA